MKGFPVAVGLASGSDHHPLELGGSPTQVTDLGRERPGELGANARLAIEARSIAASWRPPTSWATVRP
jgi:hypothetical protein